MHSFAILSDNSKFQFDFIFNKLHKKDGLFLDVTSSLINL